MGAAGSKERLWSGVLFCSIFFFLSFCLFVFFLYLLPFLSDEVNSRGGTEGPSLLFCLFLRGKVKREVIERCCRSFLLEFSNGMSRGQRKVIAQG